MWYNSRRDKGRFTEDAVQSRARAAEQLRALTLHARIHGPNFRCSHLHPKILQQSPHIFVPDERG